VVRVRTKRWRELDKSSIPLEKLAQHFEAHNRMKAEMDRAARQGRRMGHPEVTLKDEDSKPDTSLLWSASQQEIFRGAELPKSLASAMPALKDFWIATFLLVSVR